MMCYSNNQRALQYRQPVPNVIDQLITERIVHEKLRVAGPIATTNVLDGFKVTTSASKLHIDRTSEQTGGVEIMVHYSIETDSPVMSCHTLPMRYVIEPRVKVHTMEQDPNATKCVGSLYIPPKMPPEQQLAHFIVAVSKISQYGGNYGFELCIMFYSMNSSEQLQKYQGKDKSLTMHNSC